MSIANHATHLLAATVAIPAVDALPAEGMVEKLASGSAQLVLAVVVVAEALAIYKLFSQWRKDVAAGQDKLENLIEGNTTALVENKTSNEQLCHSIERFERVVERCDHHRQ